MSEETSNFTLDEIAITHKADKSSLYHNYVKWYSTFFAPFRFKKMTLVEIGVQFGASIKTWLDYFPSGIIHGIDNLHEFQSQDPRYHFWHGNQRDVAWLKSVVVPGVGASDIVIDDGCHKADAIKLSFDVLWKILKPGGLYCIEDWEAVAYEPMFSSPLNPKDWLAGFIDAVHWKGVDYHGKPNRNARAFVLSELEKQLDCIHISKGLIVLAKKS